MTLQVLSAAALLFFNPFGWRAILVNHSPGEVVSLILLYLVLLISMGRYLILFISVLFAERAVMASGEQASK